MESNPKKMLEGLHIPSGLGPSHDPTGGYGRCGCRKVRLGTVSWHGDPDKQYKMDRQIFFYILASHPQFNTHFTEN